MMMNGGENRRGPFTVLSTRIAYQNPWIKVREDRVIRPGGSEGLFGIVEMVAGSSVLPLDDDGSVYLVGEYKYGIERESVEVISGAIEANESPLDAARRELQEEVGLVADDWMSLGAVDPFTTVVRSPNHMFLARRLSRTDRNPDEGEDLRLTKVPFEAALCMVLDGRITHSASCVAILRAARILSR